MCNCEELGYEDYEAMVNVIAQLPEAPAEEQREVEPIQAPAPLIQVSTKQKK
jgi:hypothetical protein